jgi:hypothetical protein
VVIDDLNLEGIAFRPFENDSPLLVDPNRIEPFEIPSQSLQPIGRWNPHLIQLLGFINLNKLPVGAGQDGLGKAFDSLPIKHLFLFIGPEAFDHGKNITVFDNELNPPDYLF